ncbi:hypothetical protein [Microbacterium suwonense]|uniref:Uncharacterized protein n=1 Tax=Microbacterium suwonense TaxID=683047 RepID=A0ABN6X1I9_9MICO|nr:hypothetical protein [Microbacterium suwonense]BDZ38571.1 hypothetical protein GCM10025863_11850 [Microbacterium suwonense]
MLDVESVARLCAHLDGLPLAIELAAARVRTMTPEQIEARLQNRFELLTTGERTAPARHRTLEAVIAWSWDLLDAEARQQNWTRGVALLQLNRIGDAEPLFDAMIHGRERTQEGLEQASMGWLGVAEVGRLRGDGHAATAACRHSLSLFRDRDQRASPWFLVAVAATISAVVLDGPDIDEDPAYWAARLRGRFLATQRLRPQLVDKPILGTVLIGWSAWALTDPAVRSRGLEALALAETLGTRQDLPSMRISVHLAHAESILGADAVRSARTAFSRLTVAERTARAFTVLGPSQR